MTIIGDEGTIRDGDTFDSWWERVNPRGVLTDADRAYFQLLWTLRVGHVAETA